MVFKRFLTLFGMTGSDAQRKGESVAASPPRFLPPFHQGAVSFRMKRSGMRNLTSENAFPVREKTWITPGYPHISPSDLSLKEIQETLFHNFKCYKI